MNETNDASAMFAPLWRRKWLILLVGILVAAGTYLYYRHQSASYQAATQIYLGAGAEEQITATGAAAATGRKGGIEASAQAVLINSPIIKQPVRVQLRKQHKTKAVRAALRGKAKAKASEKSEFLTITSEARDKAGAMLLADLTAQTYVRRQNARYRHAIEGAIALTTRQIHRLTAGQEAAANQAAKASKPQAKGGTSNAPAKGAGTSTSNVLQIASLSAKLNQLEGNLGIQSVRQVSKATAKKLTTSPKRNAIFGFLVGLLLASLLAYVLARADPRLRTLSEIESAFAGEILTALPTVRRPIVSAAYGPRPSRLLYEPLGRLQTSLQAVVNAHQNGQPARPRTVLFTSAQSGDGVSTVVAGLALLERDAIASVAVVEANLRRPTLAARLGVDDRPGLADVLEGRLAVSEAIQSIGGVAAAAVPDLGAAGGAGVAVAAPTSSVSVLVGSPIANPSALLTAPAMADTLSALAATHEYVLIDAPAPLEVGDAIPLLPLVDAIVVVARSGQTPEAAAHRLMQLLRRMSNAPVLGVVANGVSPRESRRYGLATYTAGGWRGRLKV